MQASLFSYDDSATYPSMPTSEMHAAKPNIRPVPNHRHNDSTGQGSLMELNCQTGGGISPLQLLPLLAQTNQGDRWLMWLSPSCPMNKQWLSQSGLEDAPVMHMASDAHNQYQLIRTITQAGTAHMIIEWQGALSEQTRTALTNMAQHSGSHLIVITTHKAH